MKIIDQNLQLSAQRYAAQESHRERVHETFVNGQLATRDSETHSSRKVSASHSQLQIGQARDVLTTTERPALANRPDINLNESRQQNQLDSPNLQNRLAPGNQVQTTGIENQVTLPQRLIEMIEAVEAMMERLTGKEYTLKVMGYGPEKPSEDSPEYSQPAMAMETPVANDVTPSTGERWVFRSSYHEIEQTSFQAQGRVTTADGREIEFAVQSQMYRNFSSQMHIEKEQGVVLKDPLVINFDGAPANLTLDKFAFDLDADGKQEQISFVNGNSAFLAFDRNQDGVINDGTELFGAMTGNGFTELAQFDEDGNGWIDENDAIFSKLQVWQKDSNGFDQLSGLLEMNVGAISLSNVETQFAIKDDSNQQHGQIASSGIYLKENGGAGTIQQVDLVV